MKTIYIELENKKVGFKLGSQQICEMEKQTGKSVLKYAENMSMTAIVTLLKHMRRWEEASFSHNEACELFDELAENGYGIAKIFQEIIQPVFIESGLLTKGDLEKAEAQAQATQETSF